MMKFQPWGLEQLKMASAQRSVFVSYAHKDRKWADELTEFMAPWIRQKRLNLWDDSQIPAGENWGEQIDRSLEEATVAVLLVTNSFLASEFITQRELPVILERASRRKIRIAWVAVEHSGVEATKLWRVQAVNDPAHPLDTLSKPQRNKAMVEIAKKIADAATIGTLASGLRIIDETTEPMEAALERRPETESRTFAIQASYEPSQDHISFTGVKTTITAEDLVHLPDDDREFIADMEESLGKNYQRWKALRKELGVAGGALDGEVQIQLTRIERLMCGDLKSILGFLSKMHKYELADHYGRYRYICDQLPAS